MFLLCQLHFKEYMYELIFKGNIWFWSILNKGGAWGSVRVGVWKTNLSIWLRQTGLTLRVELLKWRLNICGALALRSDHSLCQVLSTIYFPQGFCQCPDCCCSCFEDKRQAVCPQSPSGFWVMLLATRLSVCFEFICKKDGCVSSVPLWPVSLLVPEQNVGLMLITPTPSRTSWRDAWWLWGTDLKVWGVEVSVHVCWLWGHSMPVSASKMVQLPVLYFTWVNQSISQSLPPCKRLLGSHLLSHLWGH